jgi:S-adenosylmethionine decarboxylase
MQKVGFQIYAELYNCNPNKLSRLEDVREIFLEVITSAKLTILKECFHQFNPHGVTGNLILSESHANIHTWPEHGYVSVDIFTCDGEGEEKSKIAIQMLKEKLGAKRIHVKEFHRGIIP